MSGLDARRYGGVSLVAWMEIALTAVAALLAATATVVAYGSQRRLAPSFSEDSMDAERYTARAGFLTSSIFTFVILFESIAILFYLRSC